MKIKLSLIALIIATTQLSAWGMDFNDNSVEWISDHSDAVKTESLDYLYENFNQYDSNKVQGEMVAVEKQYSNAFRYIIHKFKQLTDTIDENTKTINESNKMLEQEINKKKALIAQLDQITKENMELIDQLNQVIAENNTLKSQQKK